MASLLPRFLVLAVSVSPTRYMRVMENVPASLPSGFLEFDGDIPVVSPQVKFQVEEAETGDGRLVHIRSCYNNKYLQVAHQISSTRFIAASGDKPEEDQSNPSCTLFEPYRLAGDTRAYIRHVQSRSTVKYDPRYAGSTDTQHGLIISVMSSSNGAFNAIDWETLVILPSQVSFRSEELDGNYLCSRVLQRYPYQRFESGLDVGDPLVAKELFVTREGNYRIKDGHFGKFWRRSPNWIWADAEDNNNSNDTLFSFVKISDNVIALRNLGNNNFCGGLTTEGKTNCLNAQYPTISRQTRLVVEERVLSRDISGVRYRLSDARIYQEHIEELAYKYETNDLPNGSTTSNLTFSIRDVRTSNWSHSVSLKLGVKTTFITTIIPAISEGKVEVSTEFGYTHQWGETTTIERTRTAGTTAVVPPLTTVKVSLMATRAACDVPFSYTQRDVLTDGRVVTTQKDDGLYTGVNSYGFYSQTSVVGTDEIIQRGSSVYITD